MAATLLTYQDYINRLNVQDILCYAGYKLNRRDGLRYPCYIRLDSDGRRIRGDKFVVTQNGKCCFKPPVIKSYNIISLIKDFPELFRESVDGTNGDRLVNMICRKILNVPEEQRQPSVAEIRGEQRPFDIRRYTIQHFEKGNEDTQKAFYPFFKHRGIGLMTQYMFRNSIMLATHTNKNGRSITNLSFPLRVPGQSDIVGFEERGRMFLDGSKGYKGKAEGSNGSEGLWIASPNNVRLSSAKDVYWFESAYDAMAYFQTHIRKDYSLYKSVFVSTGGTPTVMQAKGMLAQTPQSCHHLCFDNDLAGKQFVHNFEDTAATYSEGKDFVIKTVREVPDDGYKDWNDELLGEQEDRKRSGTLHTTVNPGLDLDGDGEDDTIELEQNVEDRKQHFARHV